MQSQKIQYFDALLHLVLEDKPAERMRERMFSDIASNNRPFNRRMLSGNGAVRTAIVSVFLFFMLLTLKSWGDDLQQVIVSEAYIDLRTGPGITYPKFNVAQRGEVLIVLIRKTSWYKVRAEDGTEGWVSENQLGATVNVDGSDIDIPATTFEIFRHRKWELGIGGGNFGGADLVSFYGARSFTENISTELTFSQALGTFSNSYIYDFSVVHQAFPEWRCSPFFLIGTGKLRTEPKATLVSSEDRSDTAWHIGVGVRYQLSRRFIVRAEFRQHLVLTSRDDDEEIEQWKIGFSTFF